MAELVIRTDYWPKPIPTDRADWTAWVDGQEEWGSGYGATQEEAIADLKEWLELRNE